MTSIPRWLEWAREIQALAQTGAHYSSDDFNRQRYARLTGIAAEIIAEHTNHQVEPIAAEYRAQTGYATPRVDVRAAVFQEDKLLMVRERLDGGWTMPGGWADVGDLPSHAAEREVWEEAGFRVRARQLVGVYDANRSGALELFHAFKIIFLCDLLDGTPTPSSETSEVAFFARANIPHHLSGFRTLPCHIADAFHHLENPDCPAVFD